jgi:starch synthase (maltosyl-transferring)
LGVIGRIVIDDVRPRTPSGSNPAKAVVGQPARISADIFRDGHDILAARVRWRSEGGDWQTVAMEEDENDRWEAFITPSSVGFHAFVIEAWTDHIATWRHHLTAKRGAGQDVEVELEEGARLLEARAKKISRSQRPEVLEAATTMRDTSRSVAERVTAGLDPDVIALIQPIPESDDLTRTRPFNLWVDRERAVSSAWYEFFPRSEGGFEGAAKRLGDVADMGFDVVYFPPIHPIGSSHRKGRNNTLTPADDDPGSPWAIGSEEGGHMAIHPELGTMADFERVVGEAKGLGMEIALDYALQCSPDHPWVRDHPEWFHQRPDGSIKYAENPPKKYQDIYPINFWPASEEDRRALWDACKEILDFWIDHGVRIFRVDNPHTKPFAFWEWVIPAIQADHPDVLFLAEAFTRPKVMAKLAEVGFTQSYTYFTWRTGRDEFVEYLEEIALGTKADYMRPNFWPNTPDILSGPLRNGSPAAFRQRLVLAATLVPSFGIYSGYELCENVPFSDANEEYFESEKYEIKTRDWTRPDSLAPFIAQINEIRRQHRAFARLGNIAFHHTNNPQLLAYSKVAGTDVVLTVVNLDSTDPQDDWLGLDLDVLGMPHDRPYVAHDLLTGETYTWTGAHPYVRLDPNLQPAHIFHLRPLS